MNLKMGFLLGSSSWEIYLNFKFMEPILMELIPGGSKFPVSASRVQEYVGFVLLLVCHTHTHTHAHAHAHTHTRTHAQSLY